MSSLQISLVVVVALSGVFFLPVPDIVAGFGFSRQILICFFFFFKQLRAQNQVLKKAVVDEQTNSNSLKVFHCKESVWAH